MLTEKNRQELILHFIALGRKNFWAKNMYVSRGPVARLIKRELALLTPFKENIPLGEDEIWNIELAKSTERLAVVKSLWYYYIYNTNSATKKYRENSVEEQLSRIDELRGLVGEEKYKISLLEKKIDCVQEMVTQKYIFLLPKYGSIKINKQFFNMQNTTKVLDCSFKDFVALRMKYKIKLMILKYSVFPVDVYKIIMGM